MQSCAMSKKEVDGDVAPSVCTTMLCNAGKVASARVKRLSRLMVLKARESRWCSLQAPLEVMMRFLVSERSLQAGEVTLASLKSSMSTLMVF
jgi:hypothetical protein